MSVSAQRLRGLGLGWAVTVLVLCTLSGVSRAETGVTPRDPVRIKFAFSSNDATERQLMLSQIERFNASHPAIQVRAVPRLWEGYGIFDSYVRFLALQDPAVDVYMVDNPWIPEFVQPGWLLPLEQHVRNEDLDQWADNAVRWGRHSGHLYGLPINYKANLLFYREDLLANHNLKPPRTIDELAKAAGALQRDEKLPIGLGLHALYFYNDVFPFFYASGGSVLENDKLVLASRQNTAALSALVGLFQPAPGGKSAVLPRELFFGEWSKTYGAPIQAFGRGDAAFAIGWSRNYFELERPGSVVRGKVGITAIPGVDAAAGGGSNFGSWYLVVSSASQHPAESVEFIRYMLGPDVQRERLVSLGDLPVRKDLLLDPKRSKAVASMLPILDRARPRPRVPNERAFDAVVERHLQAAARGDQTPAQALVAAEKELAPLLPREIATLPPLPEPVSRAPSIATFEAQRLRFIALAAGLIMLGIPWLLVVLRDRFRVPVLRRIRDKLFVFGVVLSGVLLAVSAGLMTSNAITDQDEEYDGSRQFFRSQAARHATTTAKNLSLSASIVADFSPLASAELGTAEMKQLMMASHFSEDLLFFEIWDKKGKLAVSQEDALYLDPNSKGDLYPAPPDLRARVLRRAILVDEQRSRAGTSYLEAFAPIHRRGEHIGALRIGLSQARFSDQLQRVDERHRDAIRRIASTGGILALLLLAGATVASVVLSRRLATPIAELTEKAEAVRRGELDVEIVARSPDEIGTLATTMSQMVQGLRDRDFIREVLGRYVASEIVERFLADPSALALGGASRRVTILMSDLRGFTRLAADLGPQRTILLLNEYFAVMFEVIQRHRGLINEVRGDGILVVFGVPESSDDDAKRAVACAVEMQSAMKRFREKLRAEELPDVRMGIGLHTGEVIAGNIGSAQRAKFGVVGDAVNLAARIESFSVGGDVLASATTVDAAGEAVRVGPRRHVRVKGRSEELALCAVLGFGDLELGIEDDEAPLPLPAPGLTTELRRVEDSRVSDAVSSATLTRYAAQGAELLTPAMLEVGTEIVLRATTPDGARTSELFGKILDCEPSGADSFCARLRWTSVLPDDAATLAALTAATRGS
jgi:ABC-type glycerol-3-phosphate transport system substrate-binding protein/class 3 adenylate cyclase